MKSCKIGCALFPFLLSALTASAEIEIASFNFSMDDGKTWREDYPLLVGTNRTFILKVEWKGGDERKLTWAGLIRCWLTSEQDFASSEGREQGSPLFCQMHDMKYKKGPAQYLTKAPQPYYFHVDLNARSDKERLHPKTMVPLPACEVYAPGTWYFACHVGYHLELPDPKTGTRLVEAVRNFFVYIDDPNNSVIEGE